MKALACSLLMAGTCAAQFAPTPCFTALGPCQSEATGIATKAQLALSHAQHVLMVARATAILADAVKNSVQQKGMPVSALRYDLEMLGKAMQFGNALAYSAADADKRFRVQYPGYVGPTNGGYAGAYSAWSRTALDTMSGVMAVSQLSHSHALGAAAIISVLQNMIGSVDGRLKAMQVSAVMAQRQAESMEQLHAIMLADVNSKQAFMAYQVQRDASSVQAGEQFFQLAKPVGDGYVPPEIGSIGP